jgi:prevent-host-death family protein
MDVRTTEFAAAEAKARFSELLDRAEAGEEITIRRHGKVVARLAPAIDRASETRRQSREEYIIWLKNHGPTLGPDLTIKQLIEEGRRY